MMHRSQSLDLQLGQMLPTVMFNKNGSYTVTVMQAHQFYCYSITDAWWLGCKKLIFCWRLIILESTMHWIQWGFTKFRTISEWKGRSHATKSCNIIRTGVEANYNDRNEYEMLRIFWIPNDLKTWDDKNAVGDCSAEQINVSATP